jgi:hypothetical protein
LTTPASRRASAYPQDTEALAAATFTWTTFDVRNMLPAGWDAAILDVTSRAARYRLLAPTSETSREGDATLRLPTLTVDGTALSEHLPWLAALYRGKFRDLAQRCVDEPVSTAQDPRYGAVINVKRGNNMRYECHVDSNPLEGLLYVTTHLPGSGGELVVSNKGDVPSLEAVDSDCATIHPVSGRLVFFNASGHSHYVRALKDEAGVRAVVAMNYYTPASPESARPADLNQHLFGEN